mgnify:CR=1 FL=1
MKKFKRLAACLLVAVMALAMLSACGGMVNAQLNAEKEKVFIEALNDYRKEENKNALKQDETMDMVAKNCTKEAVTYTIYPDSLMAKAALASAAIMPPSPYGQDAIMAMMAEDRYLRLQIPETAYSKDAVIRAIKEKGERCALNTDQELTQYGVSVSTYNGTVYVCMFME